MKFLEPLKEVSKIVLLPTAILYALGFICISSYLARFGIVSFDVINSRFIIAGIYPLISLAAVVSLTWALYKKVSFKNFFETSSWHTRVPATISFLAFTFIASEILAGLMGLGSYQAPLAESALRFRTFLGNYDFIGAEISNISFTHIGAGQVSPGFVFVVKDLLYFSFYSILATLLVFAVYLVWQGLFKKSGQESSQAKSRESVEEKKQEETSLTYSRYQKLGIFCINLLILSTYLSIFIYASQKLGVEIFDFQSFANVGPPTQGLIFSWMITSSLLIYLFLNNFGMPEKITVEDAKRFLTYPSIQFTMQSLILPLLSAIFIFGATIFPRIPYAIGGGQPRPVKLFIENNSTLSSHPFFLIGENNDFLFAIESDSSTSPERALEINKNQVFYIETRSDSTSTNKEL